MNNEFSHLQICEEIVHVLRDAHCEHNVTRNAINNLATYVLEKVYKAVQSETSISEQCTCLHGKAMHLNGKGMCRATDVQENWTTNVRKSVPCLCARFTPKGKQ